MLCIGVESEMGNISENCTLLVNSCDSYADCWDGFFQLLKIQWPGFSMPIVLNTETADYSFEGLNIRTLGNGNRKENWGSRLLRTLKSINTKYVLFCLDDFYLDSPVLVDEVEKCYSWMEENPRIAYFSFLPTDDRNNVESKEYSGYERRPQRGEYRLNCQFALWNRDYLISYVRPHESPWEWELYGSKRSSRYKEEMYTICSNKSPVFSYINGGMIMRGRWNLSRVEPLITKYGLSLDLSKRESYEEFIKQRSPRKRIFSRGVKNRIHKLLSLI